MFCSHNPPSLSKLELLPLPGGKKKRMTSEVKVRRSSWHRFLVYSTRKGRHWYKYSLWQYTGQTRDSAAPVLSAVKLYYPAAWAQGCVCCPVRVIKSLCTLNTPRKCFLIKIDVWGEKSQFYQASCCFCFFFKQMRNVMFWPENLKLLNYT